MSTRCALLCALLFIATPTLARVIGDDGRRPPDASDGDVLRALGLVFCNSMIDGRPRRSAGTATLVGSNTTVLTAAHVFTDEAGRNGPFVRFDPVKDCVFRQFDANSEPIVELAFVQVEMGAYWDNAARPNQDWAVLRLANPPPSAAFALPLALANNAIDDLDGLAIKMLAYHIDVEGGRRSPLRSDGELFGIDYGGFYRLAHTADSGRMSSGAAIIHTTRDGEDIVVGVNRSSANLRDFNLAVPLSVELAEILKSFAFGEVPTRRQRIAANGR